MLVRITLFEVPPEVDAPFLARWDRARERRAAEDGVSATALHRALRRDAAFRFVDLTRVDGPHSSERAVAGPSFRAHPGLYEIAREDGDPDGDGGVILISPFEAPAGADDRFLAGWDRARGVLGRQQGHLGTRLHLAGGPAAFRFVELARWSSPLMVARALKRPEFRQAAAAMPYASHPSLYQVVRR
jgi:hypothetical protein